MSRTRVCVSLGLVAVALLALTGPLLAQDFQPPTTVEQWNAIFDKVDAGGPPTDLFTVMAKQAKEILSKAMPKVDPAIRQKLAAGQVLSVAEINAIDKAVASVTGDPENPLKEDSEELPMVRSMLQSLGPRVAKATVPTTGGTTAAGNPADAPLDQKAAVLWADLIHYIRVAQFQLAVSNGNALLQANLPPDQLLKVIESSVYAKNYEKTLLQAQHSSAASEPELAGQLNDVAMKVLSLIDQAEKAVIRNPQRIRMAIERLDDGQRANVNATELLKRAGQFAAPQLVAVLTSRNPEDVALRPLVIEAMVAVGRPLVLPMCEALDTLPRVPQQQSANVLARIGYPIALPYLKALLEQQDLDEATRASLQRSYNTIAIGRDVPAQATAAQLFLALADKYYTKRLEMVLLPKEPVNLLWMAGSNGQLSSLSIPTAIFPDVMAMRTARRALQLDGGYSDALSMWIMANFRRENLLPDGAKDPSYGSTMRSPLFYANLAGPSHVHPVLARALMDQDAELALDAIASLTATTGNETLLTGQAIIKALNYPDRRVRFEAAFAIAQTNPTDAFVGSGRIVPVLASAVRQTDRTVIIALADDMDTANQLAGRLRSAGTFEVMPGTSLDSLSERLAHVPGVSMVAIQGTAAKVNEIFKVMRSNVRMADTPLLAVVDQQQGILVKHIFPNEKSVSQVSQAAEDAAFAKAVTEVLGTMSGAELSAAQSTAYAGRALELLRDAALSGNPLFDVSIAQTAIIEALCDQRTEIAEAAGKVLALLENEQAQRALADASLDGSLDPILRTSLLKSLAVSAKTSGVLLTDHQTGKLLELVGQARGPLADAAAEAHGALNMPTDSGVKLILE